MGSGEVAIVALSTMISLKVTFSDGLGGWFQPTPFCVAGRAMVVRRFTSLHDDANQRRVL